MIRARSAAAAARLAVLAAMLAGPAWAQVPNNSVEVIVSRPETAQQPQLSVRGFFNLVKRTVANLTTSALPLSKCEKWTLPQDRLEAVRKAAAKQGLLVTELGQG